MFPSEVGGIFVQIPSDLVARMAFFKDLDTETQITSGPHVRAIGWLALGQVYPQGNVGPEFLSRLTLFAGASSESVDALGWPVAAGPHTCEFCRLARGSDNFAVPGDSVVYVCPEMITHYVQVHQYLPPQEFVSAVGSAPLPGTPEYRTALRSIAASSTATPR